VALGLFQTAGGISDGSVYTLSGVGTPGGDAGEQDNANVGSTYRNTVDGSLWQKTVAGTLKSNWIRQATLSDISSLQSPIKRFSSIGFGGGVIDSIPINTVECVKWIINVTNALTNDKYSLEMLSVHNASSTSDATLSNNSVAFEVSMGAVIPGLIITTSLSGVGVGQNINLYITSTVTTDVKFVRIEI